MSKHLLWLKRNKKKYTYPLIHIFVFEKTILISRALYTDVFYYYSVLAYELITLDFDFGLIPMIKC